MSAAMTGAWTVFSCDISKDEMAVFKKALDGLVGVDYTPVAVSSQVVSGINYDFFCNAKEVYPTAVNEAAIVSIYAPATGDPKLMRIKPILHKLE